MTKKHFEAAAELVRMEPNRKHAVVMYNGFVDLFSGFNPRFDIERFRAACNIQVG